MNFNPLDQFQGSHTEQAVEDSFKMKSIKLKLERSEKKIRQTRNILFVLAALSALGAFYEMYTYWDDDPIYFWMIVGVDFIIVGSYVVAGLMLKRNPVLWIIFALSVFSLIHVLSAVAEPASIIQGIVLKIVVLVFLIKGLNNALDIKKLKNELDMEELRLLDGKLA